MEIIKFTSFDDSMQDARPVTPTSEGSGSGEQGEDQVRPLPPHSDSSFEAEVCVNPPKPPPRSTSIYHLQHLQQQTFQNAATSDLSDLMEQSFISGSSHSATPSHQPSQPAEAPPVTMRHNKRNRKETKDCKPRPKSDIFDVIQEHHQQQSSVECDHARPLSMYGVGASGNHNHRHSRYSAYDISVS